MSVKKEEASRRVALRYVNEENIRVLFYVVSHNA